MNLTAKEHFVCHRLLVKMTEGESKRKMAHAAWCMSNLKNSYQQRYKVNSITYAKIKSEYKIDPTIYEKVSAKLKGRKFPPRTAEHSAKLGRYIRTPEHKLKLSNFRKSQTGIYKRSNETKKKMSEWQKGVPKPKITCKYCGKSNNLVNHIRWHDKKCKFFIYYN